MKEIELKLKEKLLQYLESMEKGVPVAMDGVGDILDRYIHFVIWSEGVFLMFAISLIPGTILIGRYFFRKYTEQMEKDSYSYESDFRDAGTLRWALTCVVFVAVVIPIILMSVYTILHAWLSPVTYVMERLL